jgi:hypothetical protein
MRTMTAVCLLIGVASVTFAPTARAAYWEEHKDLKWEPRTAFHEPEYQQRAWLADHCTRDRDGHEMCRR